MEVTLTVLFRDLNKAYQAFEALVNPIASPTIGEITSAKGDDAWDILMGWDLNSTRQWLQQLPVNTKTGYYPINYLCKLVLNPQASVTNLGN